MTTTPVTSQSELATAQRLLNNALGKDAGTGRKGVSACSPIIIAAEDLSRATTETSTGRMPPETVIRRRSWPLMDLLEYPKATHMSEP